MADPLVEAVPDVERGKALLAEATEGPWEVGEYEFAGIIYDDGTCACCENGGEIVWAGRTDINGKRMEAHCHRRTEDWWADDHEIVVGKYPFNSVAGNYDYEQGGIINPSDAALIVWFRNNADALLASVDRVQVLTEEKRDLEIMISGGCGCPAPYTDCPHDEPLLPALNDARQENERLREALRQITRRYDDLVAGRRQPMTHSEANSIALAALNPGDHP